MRWRKGRSSITSLQHSSAMSSSSMVICWVSPSLIFPIHHQARMHCQCDPRHSCMHCQCDLRHACMHSQCDLRHACMHSQCNNILISYTYSSKFCTLGSHVPVLRQPVFEMFFLLPALKNHLFVSTHTHVTEQTKVNLAPNSKSCF